MVGRLIYCKHLKRFIRNNFDNSIN